MKNLSFLSLFAIVAIICFQSCTASEAAVPQQEYGPQISVVSVPVVEKNYSPSILPHLEKMVNVMEGGLPGYNWGSATTCNMGLLAQCIGNISARDLKVELNKYCNKEFDQYEEGNRAIPPGSWTNKVIYYCGITNKPIGGIIGKLQKAGFTAADIQNIEFLSDPYILERTGPLDKADPAHYTLYMKTWRDMLREQVKRS